MQTISVEVFNLSELNDTAKEKAREWFRRGETYAWNDENRGSINAFCERYGATLADWSIGPFDRIDYKLEMPPGLFRGLKLCDVNPDAMPTGYCLDAVLYRTFFDEWKKTSDPRAAFDAAIYAAFKAWRDDWEHSLSDEAVDESIEINGYTFTANGEFFAI